MDTKEIIKLLIQKARVAIKDTIIIFLANIKNVTSNSFLCTFKYNNF